MMSPILNNKLVIFKNFSDRDKIIWLSEAIFSITLMARETYETEREGVADPVKLRRYNEMIHRIATFQVKVAKNIPDRMSDDVFFSIFSENIDRIGISHETLFNIMRS